MKTLMVSLLAGLSALGGYAVAQPVPPSRAATISTVVGQVTVNGVGYANVTAKSTQPLQNATRLTAQSADANVQLECANGGVQTLMGRFDAIINAAGAPSNCAIELKAGTALATSSPTGTTAGKASVTTGLIAAISAHTQFGVTVPPGDAQGIEVFVIEGEASVSRAGQMQSLRDGQVLSARTGVVAKIQDARIEYLASNLARIDVQRSGTADSVAAQTRLTAAYASVMRTPADPTVRAALSAQYSALAVGESGVARYNVAKAQELRRPAAAEAARQAVGGPAAKDVGQATASVSTPAAGGGFEAKAGAAKSSESAAAERRAAEASAAKSKKEVSASERRAAEASAAPAAVVQ